MYPVLKGVESRFVPLEMCSRNFLSSSYVILYFLVIETIFFQVSFNLKVILYLATLTQNNVNVHRLLCRILGRSPSPMKGMRGTASSLDWDHSVDTAQSPQGKQTLSVIPDLRRRMTYLFIFLYVYLADDESDGVEMGRSSSELSNLNEDWDSGILRMGLTVYSTLFSLNFIQSYSRKRAGRQRKTGDLTREDTEAVNSLRIVSARKYPIEKHRSIN